MLHAGCPSTTASMSSRAMVGLLPLPLPLPAPRTARTCCVSRGPQARCVQSNERNTDGTDKTIKYWKVNENSRVPKSFTYKQTPSLPGAGDVKSSMVLPRIPTDGAAAVWKPKVRSTAWSSPPASPVRKPKVRSALLWLKRVAPRFRDRYAKPQRHKAYTKLTASIYYRAVIT